jgi:DNA-binding NtrC family response regulator
MERNKLILICDDDPLFQMAVKQTLRTFGECRTAYNTDEALAIIRNQSIDLLLLDVEMRTPDEGLKALPKIKEIDPDIAIVMSSGRTDFDTVREAMRLGASDYIPKDFEPEEMIHTLNQVFERRRLIRSKEQQNFETVSTQRQHSLVGESAPIKNLKKMIEKIRNSQANVVITGETGTGKEVVARQLRKTLPDGTLEPFVAVDSATIQSSTAESVLFGHEKGAFTGADRSVKGVFEEADGGVVYFDELANMPLEIQAKLLRVLQEKEVLRLGSTKALKLDFRVVCASNKNLEEMVKEGRLKDDLYQRLCVLPLHLLPLRERKEDIPLLVTHFTQRHAVNATPLTFTPVALEALQNYSWPGNIRELSNVIAYLVTMTESNEIDLPDLPPKFRDLRPPANSQVEHKGKGQTFYAQVADFEKNILQNEYQACSGNISKIALSLGMDRSHLYTKLKEYGIHSARAKT